ENDELLFSLLLEMNKKYPNALLCFGDFNFTNIDWSDWSSKTGPASPENRFINCLRNNCLTQHVSFPTRARGSQTPHTLDLVISNADIVNDIYNLSPLGKSDHSILHCVSKLVCKTANSITKFNYNKGRYDELRQHVDIELANHMSFSGNSVINSDVNVEWNCFKNIIDKSINEYIPVSDCNTWKTKSTWKYPIKNDVRSLIKRKHRLWSRFQETRNKIVHDEYKKIRNLVRKESRKIATKFEQDIAHSCKSNPKKFWQFVHSKSKVVRSVGNIEVSDHSGNKVILQDDYEKASAFADYFLKVCTAVPTNVINPLDQKMSPNSMDDISFCKESVINKLNTLKINKSPGPDLIHPKVLYELRDVIAPYLSNFFEQSVVQGKIPNDWKMSSVTVIHKKR
ncbi:MAG: hypothetical protein ACHQ1D_11325, partial [Nitrososphaerales archaeon]